ncbi:nucleotidyltransferase family protein [Micromonospora sp. CPCC 205546]|uniref:nucleotidyltransferase family protein n=1 Tax=Micromonospora sp. CPCC 205546 TaxID=3122397 RepID=UPI003FA5F3FA
MPVLRRAGPRWFVKGATTTTAAAVRLDAHDQITVCAPHGLDDLLDGVWRRNPTRVSPRRRPGNDSPDTASPNAGPASASRHELALEARGGTPLTRAPVGRRLPGRWIGRHP